MLSERQCCAQLCPVQATTMPPKNACLQDRKWWCFLLSSVFTFLAGLLIVLLWRFFAFLFTRKQPAELAATGCPNSEPKKETKRQGKQEFEGTFMTEAKDWAGELISGQTTTGRILVRHDFHSITPRNNIPSPSPRPSFPSQLTIVITCYVGAATTYDLNFSDTI